MHYTCAVKQCRNASKSSYQPELAFHKLPTNREQRQRWIDAIGPENMTHYKVIRICSNHFEESCYNKNISHQERLFFDAIPTKNLPNQHSLNMPEEEVQQENEMCHLHTHQIKNLRAKLVDIRRDKKKLQERISIQNRKILRLQKVIEKQQGNEFSEENSQEVRKKQTLMNTFSEEIRKLVLTFNLVSPKAYDFIRHTCKPSFPSSNVLETWHQCYNEDTTSKVEMLKNIWSGKKRKVGNTTDISDPLMDED